MFVGSPSSVILMGFIGRTAYSFFEMQQLVIIGAGGFAREVLSWARASDDGWKIKGFLDDNLSTRDDQRLRAPFLRRIEDYAPEPDDVFLCAIGAPALRRAISIKIKGRGGRFARLVHPSAVVAEGAQLGEGVIVCPLALISTDARIEEGAVVYYHSSVDHDAVVGPFTQISGHCDIMGGVTVGTDVFLGSHAAILPRVKIGDRAVVGAGAIVTGDVPDDMTVVGVPARSHRGHKLARP